MQKFDIPLPVVRANKSGEDSIGAAGLDSISEELCSWRRESATPVSNASGELRRYNIECISIVPPIPVVRF